MLCVCTAIKKSKIITRFDIERAAKSMFNISEQKSPPITLKTKLFFEELVQHEKCGFIEDPENMTYEQVMASKIHRSQIKETVNEILGAVAGIDWYKIAKWFNGMDLTIEVVRAGVCLLRDYKIVTDITLLVAVFVASKFYEDYSFYNKDIAEQTNINRESIDFYEIDILEHNNWVVHPIAGLIE
jgi:hypothetical protein